MKIYNKNTGFKCLVQGVLLVAATKAHADINLYDLQGPWQSEAQCLVDARAIADTLNAHVSVTSVSCTGRTGALRAQINYVSDAPLAVLSTFRNGWRLPETFGGYDSRAACEANLPSERQLFERFTGRTPFVSICFDETGGEPWYGKIESPWNVAIEAIGPEVAGGLSPKEMGLEFVGRLSTPSQKIESDVVKALTARGITPAVVKARYARAEIAQLKVRVYASGGFNMGTSIMGRYLDLGTCLNEASRVNASPFGNDATFVNAFCVQGASHGTYRMIRVYLTRDVLSTVTALAPTFADFRTCDSERDSLAARIEEATGKPLRYSYCSQKTWASEVGNPLFYVHVIE